FQAEDGIRDDLVTGVQTCALPILRAAALDQATAVIRWTTNEPATSQVQYSTDPNLPSDTTSSSTIDANLVTSHTVVLSGLTTNEIGRASCRERAYVWRARVYDEAK